MRQQRPDLTEEERATLGERAKIIQEKLEALTKVPDDREPIERVEAKLEWLKAALEDPKVNDVDRAKIKHDIETLDANWPSADSWRPIRVRAVDSPQERAEEGFGNASGREP